MECGGKRSATPLLLLLAARGRVHRTLTPIRIGRRCSLSLGESRGEGEGIVRLPGVLGIARRFLQLGAWSFSGIWCLELGASPHVSWKCGPVSCVTSAG